jgi:GAF domain-containing protein
MIRHRLSELGSAVTRAIEMLRAAKHVEEVAQAVLELLGQAACSERATFWTVDSELLRLRAIASWSALGPDAPVRDSGIRHRTASLSQGNAGHVWRSRKPLWSTSLVLDTALPRALEAGLRGGVWFAVKTDTSVYGVIELLGRALELKTPDNLVVVERLGFRLGHALEELRHGNARLH